MKTTPTLDQIRNTYTATRARMLARWQSLPLRARLDCIREHSAPNYPCRPCSLPAAPSMADWRNSLVYDPAFRPSAPMVNEGQTVLYNVRGADCLAVVKGKTGYYVDEYCGDTCEPVAVRLIDFPGLLFAGHTDPWNEDLYEVDLTEWETIEFAENAIRSASHSVLRIADRLAEIYAERCREDFAEQEAERAKEEAREERETLRGDILALIADIRALCPKLSEKPAAAGALKAELRRMLARREELINA